MPRNILNLAKHALALPEHWNPAAFNTAAQVPDLVLGGLYTYNGELYKYVKFVDAVTYAAGQVVEWANAAQTSVTNDRAGGSSIGRIAAGVVLAVMTQNYYGFIKVCGNATLVTDGGDDIAAGDFLYPDPTVDGAVDSYAVAGANPTAAESILGLQCFARATAADSDAGNTVQASFCCLP